MGGEDRGLLPKSRKNFSSHGGGCVFLRTHRPELKKGNETTQAGMNL